MASIELVVQNPSGLHARPAAAFVQAAGRFASTITLENLDRGGAAVDAKSIIRLMTAGVAQGSRIRISAEGPDAEQALATLADFVNSGAGEPLA